MAVPSSPSYSIDDLIYLMARLRKPETGCPWDLKQDYRSITPSTIEEAYEVVDAIESGDLMHLREELGDLLFQVIFYSQLASEDNIWDFSAVVHGLTEKLIRRHPHVFPDGGLNSERPPGPPPEDGAIKQTWEKIKQQERHAKGKQKLLDDVPRALPAMSRAEKLQKRAAKVGFDWEDPAPVLDVVAGELTELRDAFAEKDENAVAEELGDVLFACVNLSRHLKLDAEQLLRNANQKFETRFQYIEESLAARGQSLEDSTVEEMEMLWQQAKSRTFNAE